MKSLRILIVEDDALCAMVLEEFLVGMGHEICATASTEIAAIDAADRQKPDLMIVDAGLRQGSGLSAVDQIRRLGPTPHFFLSGDAGRIRATRPDAAVLQKPFRLADLSRAINLAFEIQSETATA
jgi:CheY-like chemotaxis protein